MTPSRTATAWPRPEPVLSSMRSGASRKFAVAKISGRRSVIATAPSWRARRYGCGRRADDARARSRPEMMEDDVEKNRRQGAGRKAIAEDKLGALRKLAVEPG